jgi:hypothetical protein
MMHARTVNVFTQTFPAAVIRATELSAMTTISARMTFATMGLASICRSRIAIRAMAWFATMTMRARTMHAARVNASTLQLPVMTVMSARQMPAISLQDAFTLRFRVVAEIPAMHHSAMMAIRARLT